MTVAVWAQERPDIRAWAVRAYHRLGRLRHDPTLAIAVVLVPVLLYLVIAPIGAMVIDSVRVQIRDSALSGLPTGTITTRYMERTFVTPTISQRMFWEPLANTVYISVAVAILALALGASLAWLVVRTDLPGRRWLAPALVVPYMLPSWTFAAAWLTFFKNRRLGGHPGFAEALGLSPPEWLAFGALPIIVAETFHYFPFAYLLFGSALRSLDSQLEESAQVLGARRRVIFRRIVVPLLLPALMSALLLTFSRTIGTFGTPYLLGGPVGYTVLATSLYGNFKAGSPGVAAVIGVVMVVMGLAMLALDLYMLREFRRFVTIGGRGAIERRIPLRAGRLLLSLLVALVFIATVGAPLGLLAISTLMMKPGIFLLSNFTLDYWISPSIVSQAYKPGLLLDPLTYGVAWNSVQIAGLAALGAGLGGILIGYVAVKLAGTRIANFLRQVSFLPYLVPATGFAAAYLSLFAVSRGPIPSLYGTTLLVVIVMAVKYLPYGSRSGIAAMMQLGKEPEEAAMTCGAPWHKRILRIVVPIQKNALIIGLLLPFISGMKELSLVVMLATPGTELLTTQVLRYVEYGYSQMSNGVVILIVAIIFGLTFLVQRITKSGLAAGLGA